jgi:hypothetical protein
MPIIGLTDQGASFPNIGKIRKGSPKQKNSKGEQIQGKDLDYFRLDLGEDNNSNPPLQGIPSKTEIMQLWEQKFGKEPKAIPFYLLDDEPDVAFQAWFKEYKTNQELIHKCDGQTQHQWVTPQGTYCFTQKPCEKAVGRECKCTKTGEMRIVIPELGLMGFFTVLTHSTWDILTISQNLQMIYNMAGRLKGVKLLLRRTPRKVTVPYNGKKHLATKSLLSVEIHPAIASRLLNAVELQTFAAIEGTQAPMLPPNLLPFDEEEEPEIVEMATNFSELAKVREALGWDKGKVSNWLSQNYGVPLPNQLTLSQYNEAITQLNALIVPVVDAVVVPTNLDDIPL